MSSLVTKTIFTENEFKSTQQPYFNDSHVARAVETREKE